MASWTPWGPGLGLAHTFNNAHIHSSLTNIISPPDVPSPLCPAAGLNGLMDPVEPGLACGSNTAALLSILGHDPRR